jgi:Tat protein translocase TatB subunit
MGSFSILALDHCATVLILVLFARQVSELMGDVAKASRASRRACRGRRTAAGHRRDAAAPVNVDRVETNRRSSEVSRQGPSAGADMFDIGWSEILVIAAVAIIVVGPKEAAEDAAHFGKTMGTVRRTANDFKRQFDERCREPSARPARRCAQRAFQ